jgi:hypothetical protein
VAVRCAFLLAVFGWGAGFYGPPIYLAEVAARTGWPLTLISAAVTVHFLFGALVAANLPRLHDRLGLGFTTAAGALMTAVGVFGWAIAWQPWQLFAAALLSGAGWVAMGAVAVNAIVARWYAAGRPAALARAYNGASLGGVIFSPLWVALIHEWGFPITAAVVGCVMFLVVAAMSHLVFSRTPGRSGHALDGGDALHVESARRTVADAEPAPHAVAHAESARHAVPHADSIRRTVAQAELPRGALWRDRAFLTLAAGMAMGLFAQIGLLAHLFTLLTPALGAQATGFLVGGGTACAILGRAAAVRLLAHVNDRRLVGAVSYLVQASGAAILLVAWDGQAWAIICGVALFGMGIGNATSLPPAIAQDDFAATDVQRAVALIVAIAQGSYAFAPAIFGMLLYAGEPSPPSGAGHGALLFTAAIAIQLAAAATLLVGRRHCVGTAKVQASAMPPDRR